MLRALRRVRRAVAVSDELLGAAARDLQTLEGMMRLRKAGFARGSDRAQGAGMLHPDDRIVISIPAPGGSTGPNPFIFRR